MNKYIGIGTQVTGIKLPLIKGGEDLISIVVDSVSNAVKNKDILLKENSIVGITESLVARNQENYVSEDDIAKSVSKIVGNKQVEILFPICSRNRFLPLLRGIVKGVKSPKTINIVFSPYEDEVGNLTEEEHPITKILYKDLYEAVDKRIKVIYFDESYIINPSAIVLNCALHTQTINDINDFCKEQDIKVFTLKDICNKPSKTKGYNEDYGLLGSNYAGNKIKLFPRDCDTFCKNLQKALKKTLGVNIEVLIYGDGAYQDPDTHIWEFADPVVCPGFTKGLEGYPKEIKLKALIDEKKSEKEIKQSIKENKSQSLGTTPRRIVNLLGSLCDLTSGSGDKGTPLIYISGYFDHY